MHRIYSMAFAKVYPLYLTKVEKKGRTKTELDEVIRWLTGFSQAQLNEQIAKETTFTEFFVKSKNPARREILRGFRALGGTRTPNLLIRSQMLYPLSYKRLGVARNNLISLADWLRQR